MQRSNPGRDAHRAEFPGVEVVAVDGHVERFDACLRRDVDLRVAVCGRRLRFVDIEIYADNRRAFVGRIDRERQRRPGRKPFGVGYFEGECVRALVCGIEQFHGSCDVETLRSRPLEIVAQREAEACENRVGGVRRPDCAEVEFRTADSGHHAGQPGVVRRDFHRERPDAVGRGEIECERPGVVALGVEHRGQKLEGFREVVARTFEGRGDGKSGFAGVVGIVDRDFVVLHEVVDVDVQFDVSLVRVGDHDRELAPLSGLDARDALVDPDGCVGRIGESPFEVQFERVGLALRHEVGRAGFILQEGHRRFAQRDGRLGVGGELVGEVFRTHQRHLDVVQRADDLVDGRGLVLLDDELLRTEIDGVFPFGCRRRGGLFRTDLHRVAAHRKLQPACLADRGLQIAVSLLERQLARCVANFDDECVDVGLRLVGARLGLRRLV